MLDYAQQREKENNNPARKPYDITGYSCLHFALAVVEAAGVSLPMIIDPRPTGHMSLVRMKYRDLDFSPPSTLNIDAS